MFEKNISNLIKFQNPFGSFRPLLLSGYGIAGLRLLWLFKIMFDPNGKNLWITECGSFSQRNNKYTYSIYTSAPYKEQWHIPTIKERQTRNELRDANEKITASTVIARNRVTDNEKWHERQRTRIGI